MEQFLQKITKGLTVVDVVFTNDKIQFHLNDGRYIACPLSWFPHMANADKTKRAYFEADDFTIAFPKIDEYFSIRGLFYHSDTHKADIDAARKSKNLQAFIATLTAPLAITNAVQEGEKIITYINDGRELAFPVQWLGNLPAHTHFQVAPGGKSVTWDGGKFDLSFLFLPVKQVA